MKILYVTYIDFIDDTKSGSSVRPKKMYEAFLKAKCDVVLLQGQQNNIKKRRQAVKKVLKKLEVESLDGCYIESPSGPIFNSIDIKLIKTLNSQKIPISFFYRDAHWLFAKSWGNINPIKRFVIKQLHIRDIKAFQKYVDIFYMTSKMAIAALLEHYKFSNMKELPPGTENNIQTFSIKRTAIYVGGCSYQYGVDFLIDVYCKLHEKGYTYNLIVVTRKEEWNSMYPEGKEYPWLKVYHVSADLLESIYEKADLAFIPLRKNYYFDRAYAIKLFEYLSYGKPIISNNLDTMGEFIRRNNCGIVYDNTEEELEKAIIKFYETPELADKLYENVIKTCKENTWNKRVKTIMEDLKKVRF